MNFAVSGLDHSFESKQWVGQLRRLAFPKSPGQVGVALLAAISYYVGTVIGFGLKPQGFPISALWPPNAILLAILLIISKRSWYIALLAVLPVHLAFQLNAGVPLETSIGWFFSNAGEALLGAYLIRRFADPRTMFETLQGTLVFLGFGVLVAPLVTSFFDAAAVVSTGLSDEFWSVWTARLLSNSVSELIFVPAIIVTWFQVPSWKKEATAARYVEACALALGLAVVTFAIFDYHPTNSTTTALIYLPLSLLLVSAFRFGVAGTSFSLLLFAVISVNGTLHATGPFVGGSMQADLLSLQVLLSTAAIPLILLTAATTERKKAEESRRNVAQQLIGAQEQERERIGRELHDDVCQQLALVHSDLDEIIDRVSPSLKTELRDMQGSLAAAAQSTRELSHDLHPSPIQYLGLEAALQHLCRTVAARKSAHIEFDAKGVPSGVQPEVVLCLYRISQEALQNAIRHGGASNISVTVSGDARFIRLRIVDDGGGFEPILLENSGIGLMGIRERLRTFKGRLRVLSGSGKGTTIEARIPLGPGGKGNDDYEVTDCAG